MAIRTQQYHQFQDLNHQEQQEIHDEVKPNSILNMLVNSDKNLIDLDQPQSEQRSSILNSLYSKLSDMNLFNLRTLKISEYPESEIKETFKIFSKLVVIPPDVFFSELQAWTKQMNQKWQQDLKEQELLAFQYMEKNIFKILSESLKIYQQKNEPNRLYFGILEEYIQNGEIFKQKSKMVDFIFSEQSLAQKINYFVEKEFLRNVPQNAQYIEHFQNIWEDFSYAKQREFNPELPRKAYKTRYHYIYAWDQVYQIIAILLNSTESKVSNILSMINKLQENRNGNDVGGNGSGNQNQNQNQQETETSKPESDLIELKIKQQVIQQEQLQQKQQLQAQKERENIQKFSKQKNSVKGKEANQSNQFQQSNQLPNQSLNQSKNGQKNQKKKEKNQEQNQSYFDDQSYKKKKGFYVTNIPEEAKLWIQLSEINKGQRQEKMIQIISDLIYQDLNSQLEVGYVIQNELLEFYNFMQDSKKLMKNYNCGLLNLAKLNHNLGGQSKRDTYLTYFLHNRLKEYLIYDDDELPIILEEVKKLVSEIKNRFQYGQKNVKYE